MVVQEDQEEEKSFIDNGFQSSSPLAASSSASSLSSSASGFVKDTVETNLLATRLEALNLELFKDPRLAKFFEKPASKDDIDWRWWGLLVSDYDNVIKRNYKMVVEKVHAGVPRQMRGMVWQKFTGSKETNLEIQFKELHEVIPSLLIFPRQPPLVTSLGSLCYPLIFPLLAAFSPREGDCQRHQQDLPAALFLSEADGAGGPDVRRQGLLKL